MERFELLKAVAVPLDESNVDTDQICPARLIRVFAEPGRHDDVFMHDRRFDEDGSARPTFVLNRPVYAGARIIVAQRNFGVGSSREAAVMAMSAAGFRAVVAESFGDIFVNNCLKNGLLPVQFIQLIDPVTRQLVASGLGAQVAASGWLLAPNSLEQASYGPVIFLLGILGSFALAYLLVRWFYHGRMRRGRPWACGFPWGNARMQDTAEGFGQPIRQIFEPLFLMKRDLPSPFDERPRYRVTVEDPFWRWIYLPIVNLANHLARLFGLMQQGRISVYLMYSFVTLAATLLAVM